MNEVTLLPCPFCGCGAQMIEWTVSEVEIKCEACGIAIDGLRAEVIAAWNRRTRPAVGADGLPELPQAIAFAVESNISNGMRTITRLTCDEAEADRYARREDMARIGCGRKKVDLFTADQVRQAQRDAVEADRARRAELLTLADDDEVAFPNGTGLAVVRADRYYELREFEERNAQQPAHGESVDTPEFRALVDAHLRHALNGGMTIDKPKVWDALIAHIDAYAGLRYHDGQQSQMARIQHLTHERDIARRAARTAGVADPRVSDMALLIARLSYSLKKAAPDHELPAKATAYLQKHDLIGSPLRAAPVHPAEGA